MSEGKQQDKEVAAMIDRALRRKKISHGMVESLMLLDQELDELCETVLSDLSGSSVVSSGLAGHRERSID